MKKIISILVMSFLLFGCSDSTSIATKPEEDFPLPGLISYLENAYKAKNFTNLSSKLVENANYFSMDGKFEALDQIGTNRTWTFNCNIGKDAAEKNQFAGYVDCMVYQDPNKN